jgi:hypothetical protein
MPKRQTKNQRRSPETRARIDHISHLLAKGAYLRPTTTQLLAEKWGVTEKTVDNYASQAANLVRLRIGDDDQIRNEMLAALRAIQSTCFIRASERWPEGHAHAGELKERNAYQWFNTAIQAMDRLAGLTGINAPKRVEVKNEITLDEIGALKSAIEANACPAQTTEQSFSDSLSPTFPGSAASWRSFPSPENAKN